MMLTQFYTSIYNLYFDNKNIPERRKKDVWRWHFGFVDIFVDDGFVKKNIRKLVEKPA